MQTSTFFVLIGGGAGGGAEVVGRRCGGAEGAARAVDSIAGSADFGQVGKRVQGPPPTLRWQEPGVVPIQLLAQKLERP